MSLNSKQIGNITEVEGMLAFLKLGYNVLTPYGDCERYDFVVEINKKFYKFQSKTAKSDNNGDTFRIGCCSSHRKAGKCVNHKYYPEDVDFFITTYNGQAYIIPVTGKFRSKILRVNSPKNNQKDGISLAEDFELEKVISTLMNE